METKEKYQIEYEEFIKNIDNADAETIGKTIVIFSQYFSAYNLIMAHCQKNYNKLYKINISSSDPDTGKQNSAAKAEVLTNASEDGEQLITAKTHLSNIENHINALKMFQKSISHDYSYSGLN